MKKKSGFTLVELFIVKERSALELKSLLSFEGGFFVDIFHHSCILKE